MSLARPKVLVLLAAFNGARWIAEQIDSILRQIDVEVHVLVSDDGSTDDTRIQVARFAATGRVEVTSQAPTGSASQNFFALIRANTTEGFDFVAFADQDDLWNEDKLKRACRALPARPSGGYSSAVIAAWPDGRTRILNQVDTLTPADFLFEGAGQGCTFVLSADFYARTRGFLLNNTALTRGLHYHDWTLYALSRVWDLHWYFDHAATMTYRQHGENDTGARLSLSGLARRLSLIRAGWYRQQLHGIADLCFAAAPSCTVVARWRSMLLAPQGWGRRLRMARFCLQGSRRRRLDRVILVCAALAGWI
jgi:rhamnosyltransferase